MITSDFHVHTCFSTDGEDSPEDMVESAIQAGLSTVCITDHLDAEAPTPYDKLGVTSFCFDPYEYVDTLTRLKERYRNQIEIRIGVEVGLLPYMGDWFKEFIHSFPFDFVIGSVHMIKGKDPFYPSTFAGRTDEEVYRETFQETVKSIREMDDFDVLGHIDYIVRYGQEEKSCYSYDKFAPEIDAILKAVIDRGKGIELNTAGLRYGLGFAHPHPEVLCRYRELGGEIITVGSDAHRPEQVAYEFGEAEKILKECGFTEYAQFKDRTLEMKQLS